MVISGEKMSAIQRSTPIQRITMIVKSLKIELKINVTVEIVAPDHLLFSARFKILPWNNSVKIPRQNSCQFLNNTN